MTAILTTKHIPDELRPVKIDRHGPAYQRKDVMRVVAADIVNGNYFERRIKYDMKPDYEKATQIAKDAEDLFSRACYELCANRIKGIALGNMSMAKTTKCNPPSTSGSRS